MLKVLSAFILLILTVYLFLYMHFAPIFHADRFDAAKRLVPGRLPLELEPGRLADDGLLLLPLA